MSLEISYMGTKQKLAWKVSEVIKQLPHGPVLDTFSGMCAIGRAIASQRQVWTNDVQRFPALIGNLLFCSRDNTFTIDVYKDHFFKYYNDNRSALRLRFRKYLRMEEYYLKNRSYANVIKGNNLSHAGCDINLEAERLYLSTHSKEFPYRLFSISFIGSYFGVGQSIEIDSCRYAIDSLFQDGVIGVEHWEWMIALLGKTICQVNNSTGQFAQFLIPNEYNYKKVIAKRRRSVLNEFLKHAKTAHPIGTKKWRSRNISFCSDTLLLLDDFKSQPFIPLIVYADPPYSEAQYSRYYHVLDTLVKYDYPEVIGKGRYPKNRFQTAFSCARTVERSMIALIEKSSQIGACLVLNYPENGLFCKSGGNILDLLGSYYRHVYIAHSEVQLHSTFGARHTAPKVPAIEKVFVGKN